MENSCRFKLENTGVTLHAKIIGCPVFLQAHNKRVACMSKCSTYELRINLALNQMYAYGNEGEVNSHSRIDIWRILRHLLNIDIGNSEIGMEH